VRLITCFAIILVILSPAAVFPSDQTTTERILHENKYFIEFVNIGVSNLGRTRINQAEQKFLDIYQHHFNAHTGYLQSDYKYAFSNVRISQEKNVELCNDMIKNLYLEDAKDILDKLAPDIIKSKNVRARLYLTLGYRDRTLCKNFMTISENSNPRLYSYKIAKFIEGMKYARRAKRYGYLALYESQDKEMKKFIFNHMFETEKNAGNPFFVRFSNKIDSGFLKELDKEYVEESEPVKDEKSNSIDKNNPGRDSQPAEDDKHLKTEQGAKEESFDGKVVKRVRFKQEKVVAKNILDGDFDKAEKVIRKYVQDFNFKLILATIEVLSVKNKESADKVDYSGHIVHHYDNFARLQDVEKNVDKDKAPSGEKKKSLLEEISGKVRVVGDIKKDEPAKEGREDEKTPAPDDNEKKDDKK
jgi:hypothetical protein